MFNTIDINKKICFWNLLIFRKENFMIWTVFIVDSSSNRGWKNSNRRLSVQEYAIFMKFWSKNTSKLHNVFFKWGFLAFKTLQNCLLNQIYVDYFGTEVLQSYIIFPTVFLYYIMRLFGISNCAKFLQRLPWIWSRYHLMTWKITQRFHFPIVTFLCSLS